MGEYQREDEAEEEEGNNRGEKGGNSEWKEMGRWRRICGISVKKSQGRRNREMTGLKDEKKR
ncbi:hypothetical protein X777_11109 [Ooceraea biroi]|uniref:Uncharacterized protein n=1 Tax=Ooceraea biroi TaxID=2015173 RepID=A0A026W3T3_OOCBI|nr:hypothetical protein X777_11109 [Ooceraea biroi]